MVAATQQRQTSPDAIDESEYVDFGWVPVWREHSDPDGNHFGKAELARVCERCNERIADTGDYCPIVLGHRPKPAKGGVKTGPEPEVVGHFGPFKTGTIGNKSKSPAIFARMMVFKEDAAGLKKFPRLSVEYWGDEDDPTNGYFDPIALLGAETPELDLGTRYEKQHRGRRMYSRLTYEAELAPVAPGSSNTYVPGGKKKNFEKEDDAMEFSPEQLKQLTDAMLSAVVPVIDEKMAALNPVGDDIPGAEGGLGEGLGGELGTEGGGEGLGLPVADEEKEFGDMYAKMCQQYDAGDDASMYEATKDWDDEKRGRMNDYLGKSEADEEKRGKLTQYMAQPTEVLDPAKAKEIAKPGEARHSEKPGTAAQYQKERDEFKRLYEKEVRMNKQLKANAETLEDRVTALERDKRHAERYQKFSTLEADGVQLNPEEETNETIEMADEDFARYCEKVSTKYQRLPLNRSLQIMREVPLQSRDPNKQGAQYHKRAMEIADERRGKGERNVIYKDCLAQAEKEGKAPKVAATA